MLQGRSELDGHVIAEAGCRIPERSQGVHHDSRRRQPEDGSLTQLLSLAKESNWTTYTDGEPRHGNAAFATYVNPKIPTTIASSMQMMASHRFP